MAIADLNDWMVEFSGPEFLWLAKRLTANDTMATDSHQVWPVAQPARAGFVEWHPFQSWLSP